MKKSVIVLLAVVGAVAFAQPARKRPTIAVIPKGTTHVYWKGVEAGAKKAGEEFNAEIIFKGPIKENDRAGQIQVVQQFVSQGVDGIALAPLDIKALVGPVQAATAKKIPVVIIDSALDGTPGKDFSAYIATNNEQAGKLGGEELVRLLEKKGKAVLLRYQVGSASTDDREKGFLSAVAAAKDCNVISDNRFAGPTAGEAKTAALNMIDDIKKADGVFTPNESSTLGMLLALRQEGLAGKIKFVGFDSSPPLVEALKKGEIHALVVQSPRKMGYDAVKAIVRQLNGEKIEATMDTGAVVVTKANLEQPEIKALIE